MNFFVNDNQILDNKIYIKNSDVNHIKNVLRKRQGDKISVICNNVIYNAKIIDFSNEQICCEILEKKDYKNDCKISLTIFQGLAKADKIDYIIQKCSELGVDEIIPIEMKRCVVKLDGKDKEKKLSRWQKIAEVAAKQSLRNNILKIDKIYNFEELCLNIKKYDCVIMAYEKEQDVYLKDVLRNFDNSLKNIAVIIGPEGGIDDSEAKNLIDYGVRSVSLGKRILRTETAPVVVSAIIMYEIGS